MRSAKQHFMMGLVKLRLTHLFDEIPGVYIAPAGAFVKIDPIDLYIEPKKIFDDSTDPAAIEFADQCLKVLTRELFRQKRELFRQEMAK